jgi:hypothetical protein
VAIPGGCAPNLSLDTEFEDVIAEAVADQRRTTRAAGIY